MDVGVVMRAKSYTVVFIRLAAVGPFLVMVTVAVGSLDSAAGRLAAFITGKNGFALCCGE